MPSSLHPVLPLVEEEIGYLKDTYAFLHHRFEIESKIIEGLEKLLENAPQVPASKLSWYPAVKQLVEDTRIELETRRAIHQTVADQISTFGRHVDRLGKKASKLNLEMLNLDTLETVETARRNVEDRQHEWKLSLRPPRRPGSASRQSGSLRGSACAPEESSSDSEAAKGAAEFLRYLEADLILRRLTCNMNDARHTFSQKLPDRIYEQCALYRSTVSGLQTSLTAFGDYQRGIATGWNKNGFSLWLLAEGIKPLIDSGLHCNEVKIGHDGLNISFPELTYHNTAFQQYNGVTQPILFGRSTQSIHYQTHPSARTLPEYLLDGVSYLVPPTRNEALYTPDIWSSINTIEQSWTSQEEQNRQVILKYPSRHRCLLFLVYLQCLPNPLVSLKSELRDLIYNHEIHADLRARSLWEAWSYDPAGRSVLTALLPRLRHPEGRLWSTARPFIPNRRIVYCLLLLTQSVEDDPTLSYLFSMMVDIEPWNTGTEIVPATFTLMKGVETSETEDWDDYVESASEA